MSILANAKNKATSGSVKAAFTNEDGAIDLASIMVGIIVIGLIGGVIAATVFAVIPWAQDNAAKQQLDSVASAESAYIGLSTDSSTTVGAALDGKGAFGDDAALKSASLFDGGSKVVVKASGTGTNAHYAAVTVSGSGNFFKISDQKTQATNIGKNASGGTPASDEGGAAYAIGGFTDYASINGAK